MAILPELKAVLDRLKKAARSRKAQAEGLAANRPANSIDGFFFRVYWKSRESSRESASQTKQTLFYRSKFYTDESDKNNFAPNCDEC